MKTSEFKRQVAEIHPRWEAIEKNDYLQVVDGDGYILALVYPGLLFDVNTNWSGFTKLDDDLKEKLLVLLVNYASTPIDERGDVKRFIVVLPEVDDNIRSLYLTKDGIKSIIPGADTAIYRHQTMTETEIKAIDKRYLVFAKEIKPEDITPDLPF